MLWGCYASTGTGKLAPIEGIMNSQLYQEILQNNVSASVKQLKLKHSWVFQQDNDPKHTSASTKACMKKKKYKLFEWPSQSPYLNPIEMLWHDLKQQVHARKPRKIGELKQYCLEEWQQIPIERCQCLVREYKKRLQKEDILSIDYEGVLTFSMVFLHISLHISIMHIALLNYSV